MPQPNLRASQEQKPHGYLSPISIHEEVKDKLKPQRNNKAPSVHKIPAHLLQTRSVGMATEFHQLINTVWSDETIPKDWRKSWPLLFK